jgi:hypothetical protein
VVYIYVYIILILSLDIYFSSLKVSRYSLLCIFFAYINRRVVSTLDKRRVFPIESLVRSCQSKLSHNRKDKNMNGHRSENHNISVSLLCLYSVGEVVKRKAGANHL